MFKQSLQQISEEFLLEARNSPRLLKDMAAMESYLAESYGDRILIELLQNADDAKSDKAMLRVHDNYVIFANNGRPFTDEDLMAICRSGSSSKVRGKDIGYRGVGFKSSTSISNNILISSSDTIFTFSKKICATTLRVYESDVPTVRVPFAVESRELPGEVQASIATLHQQGFNTVFVFMDAKQSVIIEEIKGFDKSCLLFLRNISELRFENDETIVYSVIRTKDKNGTRVDVNGIKSSDKWLVVNYNTNSSIAFKLDQNERVIACEPQEAVFHCYLPTLDPSPIRVKINAEFSTDPSRKHLSINENSKAILEDISTFMRSLVESCIAGTIPYVEILRVFTERVSYSAAASLLYDAFYEKLLADTRIALNSGEYISLSQYKLHEDFLSEQEKLFVSNTCHHFYLESVQYNSLGIQAFLEHFGKQKFTVSDYSVLLCDHSFIKQCDPTIHAKVFSYVIKAARTQELIYGNKYALGQCLVLTETGIILASSLDTRSKLNSVFEDTLIDHIGKEDWSWFSEQNNISYVLYKATQEGILKKAQSAQTQVSKWRSAEQSCVDIENDMGNKARYVGNQNLGYDVESTMPNGQKRYIEVKLLSSSQGGFTMTNNEYSSAHQYGDAYYMCIINQKEKGIDVTYIQNPIANIALEKRVRQWEWYCESFAGDECSFPYKEVARK